MRKGLGNHGGIYDGGDDRQGAAALGLYSALLSTDFFTIILLKQ
jgi:hypothetical protein